jgi:hypothetical protein
MATDAEINDLAEEAAQAALDAHGIDQLPSASVAYSFMCEQVWPETKPVVPVLSGTEFRQFKHDYRRHLRNAGVPLEKTLTL